MTELIDHRPSAPSPQVTGRDVLDRSLGEQLTRLAGLDRVDPVRTALRNELAVAFRPLVDRLVRRFAASGEPPDDLQQVGMIGLLHALDRFVPPPRVDPLVAFMGLLVPTVRGEVSHHIRDRTWIVRVPRGIKDIQAPVLAAVAELEGRTGRAPRPAEVAAHLGRSTAEVVEALTAASARTALPIDVRTAADRGGLGNHLATTDATLARAEARTVLRGLLRLLPARERRVLGLRFLGDLTQSQIAAELGMSQMHVSRLLGRSLARLRAEAEAA